VGVVNLLVDPPRPGLGAVWIALGCLNLLNARRIRRTSRGDHAPRADGS
jgi:hypothetical protein